MHYMYLYTIILVNGQWGNWSAWSGCGVTCGGGLQSASRACDSPAPANGGRSCMGGATKYQACNTGACSGAQVSDIKIKIKEFLMPDINFSINKYN